MASGTRTLDASPSILPLYARAGLAAIPGAGALPFVGGGERIPELELRLEGVAVDRDRLAAYCRVCGFALRDVLPPTYPHVLGFPLHLALMTDPSFPFAAIGLVHVGNRIVQHRPIGAGEELAISVRAGALEPHPKGRQFSIVTEARVGSELVWESASTMLRRGRGSERAVDGGRELPDAAELPFAAEWRLGGDAGRRYAAVSGDRNPIHLYEWTAKPFGFPKAIVHGMWTKARCLAALEGELPDALEVEVRFRKPILLAARLAFASRVDRERIEFAVRDAAKGTPHLEGALEPVG